MNKHNLRRKRGIKEIDKCYLCNNKAQNKCSICKQKICNDCESNKKCYKCDVIEVKTI